MGLPPKLTTLSASIIVAVSLVACSPPSTTKNTSEKSTVSSQIGQLQVEVSRQLAQDAYVYGLQQVIFYQTRYNYTQNETTEVF
jgi:hypothetical protein